MAIFHSFTLLRNHFIVYLLIAGNHDIARVISLSALFYECIMFFNEMGMTTRFEYQSFNSFVLVRIAIRPETFLLIFGLILRTRLMRTRRLPFTLMVTILLCLGSSAQDFSNKGREFWLAYCYHVGMINPGGPPTMTLYITSDLSTNYTIEIFGGPVLQSGSITAGQVVTAIVPPTYFINDEGTFTNRAIHITSDRPVVVYSYITRSQASGATLCLPTAVLGKEYYSMNFTQVSNEPNSNSYVTIVAVEDNTTVQITPSANTKNGWVANNTYSVNLNKGDIYQVLGALDPVNDSKGVDLTGTHVQSISAGTGGCKKIAVFSGSGKVRIPESCNTTSSDNLYQQLYPTGSWGLKYLTAPSYANPYNYYRIEKSNPAANVFVNGAPIPAAQFANGIWYQFFGNQPNVIESDLPISVAQYFTTQGCDGNTAPSDPDMIVLNPVEQNIDKVTLVSTNLYAPGAHTHHLQVIIPNGGTATSSFRLDGLPVSGWTVHPQDPNYSYIYLANVSQGYHTLSSDSGFNALAYGYAQAESYGYSAGANVKDLYQFISIKNQYATVNFPAGCRNSPFYFSMTFPYQPTQITWNFFGLLPDTTLNAPVYDSTWVVNGRQLYRYTLPNVFSIATAGTYPIQLVAQNPTSDGCSGEQQIDYDLQVFDSPSADFSFTSNGCLTDSVHFLSNTNTGGRKIVSESWMFGDGTTANVTNPVHLYDSPDTYVVKYSILTDVGCLSDTIQKSLPISAPPVADFLVSAPVCKGKAVTFTDQSTVISGPAVAKWTWDFGDGSPVVTSSTADSQSHVYTSLSSNNATLLVETVSGCKSVLKTKTVVVGANPVADFILPESCLNDPSSSFIDSSHIEDGTQGLLTYDWNFGDPNASAGNPDSSVVKDPQHKYSATGSYNITETVTSNLGCTSSATKSFFVNGSLPVASFNLQEDASVCSGDTIHLTDNSMVNPGTVVKVEIYWDYANDPTVKTIDDQPSPGKVYTHSYPKFNSPASQAAMIRYVAYSGQTCAQYTDKSIALMAIPALQFDSIQSMCKNAPALQITQASVVNAVSGSGNYIGPGVSSSGLFTPSLANDGANTIRYTFNTNNGCSNYIEQTVNVFPVPEVDAGPDRFVLEGGEAALTPVVKSSGPVTYVWTPATWLSNAETQSPEAKPLDDITYTLTVISDEGCKASDDIAVKILKTPRVPNIFSPNGDGIHDRWEIPYLNTYPGCTVDIYNRYGQLIFHSIGYGTPWDGVVNGRPVPVGTYYYIIDPKNGRQKMSGYVDVIR